jgi:alkyl sulfatase BDS1-like metallo-beta-lactamase superfamily hydrolase
VNVFAGNVVHRRAASSRAPGFQVAAPGERGEASHALGTAVARARNRVLKAWPPASRATRMAVATR